MNSEEKILQVLENHGEMLEALGKQLEALGKQLGGANKRLESVEMLSQRTAVLLETEYRDKLQLLYDGHSLIEEKIDGLSPKSRVDELEDEVGFLRSVVKSMSKRLDALEKVQ